MTNKYFEVKNAPDVLYSALKNTTQNKHTPLRHTMVHDRFQAVCLDGCGFISGHTSLAGAVKNAKAHSCMPVVVYDSMTHKNVHGNRWERSVDENGCVAEAYKRFSPRAAARKPLARATGKEGA